jgi:hypothetical protein
MVWLSLSTSFIFLAGYNRRVPEWITMDKQIYGQGGICDGNLTEAGWLNTLAAGAYNSFGAFVICRTKSLETGHL